MSYDVEFIQVPSVGELTFPVTGADAQKLLKKAAPLGNPKAVRDALLAMPGAKAGPGDAIDYVGKGLNFARLTVKADRVHVENNCGPKELLKIHEHLSGTLAGLLIHDLQSGQLHTVKSLQEWWAKPL